ncbi:hypothetical protein [Tannockella kyphosi]|uniref:hypothetical protein n=1 Tax=Tannockella kyphosi TaxID=2899121 RepID=UPI0020139A8E|nr:hypothetical protein [Tannockella kyphosi]
MYIVKKDFQDIRKILALFLGISIFVSFLLVFCNVTSVPIWKSVYLVIMIPFLLIQGFILFDYTKNKNSATFVNSFAMHKGEMFIRKVCSGILFLMCITFMYSVIWLMIGQGSLMDIGHCLLLALVYHCFLSCCAILTGKNISYLMLCIFVIVGPLALVLVSNVDVYSTELVYVGYSAYANDVLSISPIGQWVLPFYQYKLELVEIENILICTFYILISLSIGYFASLKQDAIYSGEMFLTTKVKDVFVVVGSCFIGLIVMSLLGLNTVGFMIVSLVGIFLLPFVVFGFSILLDKKIYFKKYCIQSGIAIVASVCIVQTGSSYLQNYIPDSAKQASVSLQGDLGEYVNFSLTLDQSVEEVKEIHESLLELGVDSYYQNSSAYVVYDLGDGYAYDNYFYLTNDNIVEMLQYDGYAVVGEESDEKIDYLLNMDYTSISILNKTYESVENLQLWKEVITKYYYNEEISFDTTDDFWYVSIKGNQGEKVEISGSDLWFQQACVEFTEKVAYELNIS